MNTVFVNFIFINVFPLLISISLKNQKLFNFVKKNRDLFYLFFSFISIAVLYLLLEKKFFVLITIVIYLLWIIIFEDYMISLERISGQNFKVIVSLKEEIKTLEQDYAELKSEYDNVSNELSKYIKLFNLVEEVNKNIELTKAAEKFYSAIVDYFGFSYIEFFGILIVKKKDVIEIISFSPVEESLLEEIKNIWLERQSFVNIEGILAEKIYSNLYEYIFVIKHKLPEKLLPHLKFFINETKIGFVRNVLFKEVEELSRIDGLTGLYLRRYFTAYLNNELLLATRYNNVFSLIMIDIDFFKKVNDTYGHIVGDFVLKELAKILLEEFKEQGLCARWGGEEFLVFIPYQSQQQVVFLAEKLRSTVENHIFQFQGKTIKITISCGISFYPQEGKDITTLIEEADKKLYKAKQSGRNKVVV